MNVSTEKKDIVDALRSIGWFCWRLRRCVKKITALTDADVDHLATSVCQATEALLNLEYKIDEINARNKGAGNER